VLPLLFLGALIMESFFGIPGLGSYTIDAINAQDFAIVRSMVFVGSALYIVGLILTDISYTVADPRIRLRDDCRSGGGVRLTCRSPFPRDRRRPLLLLAAIAFYVVARVAHARRCARRGACDPRSCSRCRPPFVLAVFVRLDLDSVHFRPLLPPAPARRRARARAIRRARCRCSTRCSRDRASRARKPIRSRSARTSISKESMLVDGKTVRDYPRLQFGGAHLKDTDASGRAMCSRARCAASPSGGRRRCLWLLVAACARARSARRARVAAAICIAATDVPWRPMLVTAACSRFRRLGRRAVAVVSRVRHRPDRQRRSVPGDQVDSHGGRDRLARDTRHAAVRDRVRHPRRLLQGRVDDAIQYLYTVLSSIPSVLLIAAFVLMIQVYIDKNPQMFETGSSAPTSGSSCSRRSWASPAGRACAAAARRDAQALRARLRAGGARVRRSDRGIMRRHILPNVMHVVLIVAVLDFSSLVLYEAVLSYVGVGVDPTTNSFGTMINSARTELSRDPVVWWNLCAAFAFMVAFVLSMQLLRERRARGVRPARARVPSAAPKPSARGDTAGERAPAVCPPNSGALRAAIATSRPSSIPTAAGARRRCACRSRSSAARRSRSSANRVAGKSMTALSILRLPARQRRVSAGPSTSRASM
jgi:peptide/nickel transport system permease protein